VGKAGGSQSHPVISICWRQTGPPFSILKRKTSGGIGMQPSGKSRSLGGWVGMGPKWLTTLGLAGLSLEARCRVGELRDLRQVFRIEEQDGSPRTRSFYQLQSLTASRHCIRETGFGVARERSAHRQPISLPWRPISITANVTTAIDAVARYRQLARLSFRAFIARGLTARIPPGRSLKRTDLCQCLVNAVTGQ
jgi:hypothetical protein